MNRWNPNCDCGATKLYNHKHECFWCSTCEKWLEQSNCCQGCQFCYKRPDKPFHHCHYMHNENISVDIEKDLMNITNYETDISLEVHIVYCPACGLKLNKEVES